MPITIEEVERIAALAKLRFSDNEKEKLSEDLNAILSFMNKLNELNTDHIEPLSHPTELTNVMREDGVEQSLSTPKALRNAPAKQGTFFKVPKVIK